MLKIPLGHPTKTGEHINGNVLKKAKEVDAYMSRVNSR